MRSRNLVGVCVFLVTCLGHVGPVAAVPHAPVAANLPAQAQSGTAVGTNDVDVYFTTESHGGRYVTGGQLGTGYYLINATYDQSGCAHPGGDITITGTADFHRTDNARLRGTATGTEACTNGAVRITVDLTFGSHDFVSAHLTLTGTRTFDHITPSADVYTETLELAGTAVFTNTVGYWIVDEDGSVTGYGGLESLGNAPTTGVTHLEPTPDFHGYWIVDSAGHVFAYGAARWLGNAPSAALAAGETVTNLSTTPTGHGYWLFTSRGRALPFGDASFLGDMHAAALNGPVIGAVATPTGRGYYMVASDGGVFAFGDAKFRGSMGAVRLNRPVNGLVPTADNSGYWLIASDGGVFAFGGAPFHGSMGGRPLNAPVVGMARYGDGYLMVASDGGLFDLSTEMFFGSLGSTPLAHSIVGVAATS
jgi:hypothetical protein